MLSLMKISLQEFLQRKGAIGLLSLLHERPMTYSEIKPEIEVTSDTIIERRDEAAELGLLNISLGEADQGTKRVYHLTDMGEALTEQMAREGLIRNYRKMRTLEQLVDEQTDELVEWVQENPSQLLAFEEAEGTVIRADTESDDSPDLDIESSMVSESNSTSADDTGLNPGSDSNPDTDTESDEIDSDSDDSDDQESVVIPGSEDQSDPEESSNQAQGTLSDMVDKTEDSTNTESERE